MDTKSFGAFFLGAVGFLGAVFLASSSTSATPLENIRNILSNNSQEEPEVRLVFHTLKF